MTRQVYVNGRYLPYRQAHVHVEDRGFQFADAVYEVCEVRDGKLVDVPRHLERLRRSLGELQITFKITDRTLRHIMRQVVIRNRVRAGMLYMQVSRGAAERDFLFPTPQGEATFVCFARSRRAVPGLDAATSGINVVTMDDPRWKRCDIKTVMLLPAVLAKQDAHCQGANEVWFVDRDGLVTEGASSTAWIVRDGSQLVTRPLSYQLLPGVTRRTLLDQVSSLGLTVVERPFSVEEAEAADEAFQTAASGTITPVTQINGKTIGTGHPGHLTMQLRQSFHDFADMS